MCRGPTRRRTVRGFQQAGTCSLVITPRRFQQAGKLWRHHRDRCARAHQGLHHAPPPAAAPHQPTTPLQREADAREIILANLLHLPRTGRSNAHVGMARCVARCVGYRSPRQVEAVAARHALGTHGIHAPAFRGRPHPHACHRHWRCTVGYAGGGGDCSGRVRSRRSFVARRSPGCRPHRCARRRRRFLRGRQ